MIYEEFYSAREIAKVLFQGDRTLHHGANTPERTPYKFSSNNPLAKTFVKAGEDKASMKSAEEYLCFLGFDERKIAIFKIYANEVVNLHLSGQEAANNTIERKPEYYAGARLNGQSLNTPDVATALEEEFVRRLELSFEISPRTKTVLLAKKEAPSWKKPNSPVQAGRNL